MGAWLTSLLILVTTATLLALAATPHRSDLAKRAATSMLVQHAGAVSLVSAAPSLSGPLSRTNMELPPGYRPLGGDWASAAQSGLVVTWTNLGAPGQPTPMELAAALAKTVRGAAVVGVVEGGQVRRQGGGVVIVPSGVPNGALAIVTVAAGRA